MSAPLCTDCKHHRLNWAHFPFVGAMRRWGRCQLPKALVPEQTSVVTGATVEKSRQMLCVTMRDHWHACGPSALGYEAKP